MKNIFSLVMILAIILVSWVYISAVDSDLETPVLGQEMDKTRLIEVTYNLETYAKRSVTLKGWYGHEVEGSMVYDEPFEEVISGTDFDTFVATFKVGKMTRLNQALRTRGILGENDSLTWWN